MKRFNRAIALAILTCLSIYTLASAQSLGSANTFAILAGSAVTNTGPSIVSGNVGVSPGSSITGFPPGVVINGSFHVTDPVAAQAQADAAVAYTAIQNMPVNTDLTGQDLGGMTLSPGVYHFASSAQLTGTLTLDAGGDPNALWYFQIGSTLTAASNAAVNVIGGGSPTHIFWQVGSSATVGTGTAFGGNILAFASITFQTGASNGGGRLLAQTGAVTIDTSNISTGPPAPPLGALRYNLNPNIGSAAVGQSVSQILTVTNESNAPVTLTGVFIQSGSVDFSVDPNPGAPFILQPGSSAFYTIRFTPMAGDTGMKTAVLRVTSTDLAEPIKDFDIFGTVLNPLISTNPSAGGTLAFGGVCLGDSETQIIDVTNVGDSPLTVTNIAANGAGVSLTSVATPFNLASGAHSFVNVTVTPTAAGPLVGGSVVITSNSGGTSGDTTIQVTATGVIPTITASPATVAFGNVCPGVPVRQVFQILNNGQCPATINSIAKVGGINPGSLTLDNVALPFTLQAGSTLLVGITVDAQVPSGTISTTVRTNINDSVVNTDVAVTAAVVPQSLGFSPTTLSFGSVCVGSTQSRTMSISNSGGCDLTVSSVAVTSGGAVYTVEPVGTPLVIPRGSILPVTVVFAPTAVGNDQGGVLTVTSDSGGVPGTTSMEPLTGNAPAGVLSVTPGSLDFGSVCESTPITRSLQIRNTGPCSLTLTAAMLAGVGADDYRLDPGFVLPVNLPPGASLTSPVTLTPRVVSGGDNATLTLTTADANTVIVPLSASVSSVPTIALSNVSGAQRGAGTAASPYVICVGASPPFTFTVTGSDTDTGETVRLTQNGAPTGATFTNTLPAVGNPVATTVGFSPGAGQGGESFAVTFTAEDTTGAACSASTTIHLRVSSLPVISASPSTLTVCEGLPIEFRIRASDADPGNVTVGLPTITSTGSEAPGLNLVHTPGLPHAANPLETVVTAVAPDVSTDSTYTITYTATDSDGCTATQVVTVAVMSSTPTTIALSRTPAGDISVDQEVCFTAVVRDNCPQPRLVAGVPVCFTVVGTTGNNIIQVGVITDANGEAHYCFTPGFPGTDTVTAVIDVNSDCVADAGTQPAVLNLTVAAPAQFGPGCFVAGRGTVDVSALLFGTEPVPGTFGLDVSPKRNGGFNGVVSFVVPAAAMRRGSVTIRSSKIEAMICGEGPSGVTAVIFGKARVSGHPDLRGTVRFRVDALDAGTSGGPSDRFTITLLSPAGDLLAGPVGGNLIQGRGNARKGDDIKIRKGARVP